VLLILLRKVAPFHGFRVSREGREKLLRKVAPFHGFRVSRRDMKAVTKKISDRIYRINRKRTGQRQNRS